MSSSDETRIAPDELKAMTEVRNVDSLTMWAEDPYGAADLGAETVAAARFGNTESALVHGDLVLWGGVIVEAERVDPVNGGTVAVIDVAAKGWTVAEAKAEVLRRARRYENTEVDRVLLAEMITEIWEVDQGLVEATGWDGDDLDSLIESIEQDQHNVGLDDEDETPEPVEPPTDPVTKRGDVWVMGPHRIMCGDCRDSDDVATLLDGATVNLAFTSPPYADRRKYDETSGFKPIPPDEYVEWFEPVQANVAQHLAQDGSWFVNIKTSVTPDGLDAETYVLDLVLAHARQWGWHWATEYCWERPGVPKQPVRRFKNAFEPVYHFHPGNDFKFRPDDVRHESGYAVAATGPGVGNTSWADPDSNTISQGSKGDMFAGRRAAGLAYPGNRLPTFSGSHEALGHSAAFPVGLPDFFVRAYTDEGDTVFDPFMGSGSTLLAAHQNDRVGFGMELSPAYVDVILTRFERATGVTPTRDGVPHSFVEAE